MANTVKYVEVRELQNRGPVDSLPSSEVDGTLLLAEKPVVSFEGNHSQYGNDYVSLYPAFHNGVRCWVECAVWDAAFGYSASGTQERILPFEEGVKLLVERGVFAFPEPANV